MELQKWEHLTVSDVCCRSTMPHYNRQICSTGKPGAASVGQQRITITCSDITNAHYQVSKRRDFTDSLTSIWQSYHSVIKLKTTKPHSIIFKQHEQPCICSIRCLLVIDSRYRSYNFRIGVYCIIIAKLPKLLSEIWNLLISKMIQPSLYRPTISTKYTRPHYTASSELVFKSTTTSNPRWKKIHMNQRGGTLATAGSCHRLPSLHQLKQMIQMM